MATVHKAKPLNSNLAQKKACINVWGNGLYGLVNQDSLIADVTGNNTDIQFTVKATGTLTMDMCIRVLSTVANGVIYKNGTQVAVFTGKGSTAVGGAVWTQDINVSSGDVIKVTYTTATSNTDCKTLLLTM